MADGFTPPDKPATSTEHAAATLEFYSSATNSADEPDETVLTDLLADLMHWADALGVDFDSVLDDARNHHHMEVP